MFRKQIECMGTVFLFQIQDQRPEQELDHYCDVAAEILNDADNVFSLYKPESEISRIVSGDLPWEKSSAVQRSIRGQVESWREVTAGFFNAREGADYDPSGLVKGWAAANAAHYLEGNGITNFTLNAGGDIYLSSELDRSVLSRVGLSNLKPISSSGAGVNMILELSGTGYHAVATSGIAERGEHIWRSEAATRFQQVSVVAKDLVSADIWATALISGGMPSWEHFLGAAEGAVAIGVFEDGAMIASPGFSNLPASF